MIEWMSFRIHKDHHEWFSQLIQSFTHRTAGVSQIYIYNEECVRKQIFKRWLILMKTSLARSSEKNLSSFYFFGALKRKRREKVSVRVCCVVDGQVKIHEGAPKEWIKWICHKKNLLPQYRLLHSVSRFSRRMPRRRCDE